MKPERVHTIYEEPVKADRAMNVAIECGGESFSLPAWVTKAWPEALDLDGQENVVFLVFFEDD